MPVTAGSARQDGVYHAQSNLGDLSGHAYTKDLHSCACLFLHDHERSRSCKNRHTNTQKSNLDLSVADFQERFCFCFVDVVFCSSVHSFRL